MAGPTALEPGRATVEDEPAPPSDPDRRPRRSRRVPWATAAALATLALLFALPLRGLLRGGGPPMEEGFMLVFPELVLEGQLPNRDFLHLYGPGSLWALAATYGLFEPSLLVQRLFALLQHVGVVAAVYLLARPWGRLVATAGAAAALVIILPPTGLMALAWVGAVALGGLAVRAALEARRTAATDPGRAGRWAVGAGLLAGASLLFRPDLVIAVALGGVAALWGTTRLVQRRAAIGLGVGLAPYLVHLATAGPWTVIEGMVLDPVVYLRGGRSLPIPPDTDELSGFLQRVGDLGSKRWALPDLDAWWQMWLWFWVMIGVALLLATVGALAVRRDPSSWRARVLLAAGLFSIGLLPQGIQRTDNTHFAWASAVSIGLLPVALLELQRRWAPRVRPLAAAGAASAVLVVLLVGLLPRYTVTTWYEWTQQSFGVNRIAYQVERDGRTFYYGRRDVADALDDLLPAADAIVPQDGGRLFVGTHDLRFTPYSDAFLYHLFPEMEPATYYIEMDPGVANREDSGLAEDVASADVLILSRVWYNWQEPNESLEVGSDEPNEVVRDRFCLVGNFGERRDQPDAGPGGQLSPDAPFGAPLFELYERRDAWDRRTDGEPCRTQEVS